MLNNKIHFYQCRDLWLIKNVLKLYKNLLKNLIHLFIVYKKWEIVWNKKKYIQTEHIS